VPESDDPIREEVERVLHALVGTAFALPIAAVGAVRRCVGRRLAGVRRRVAEPAALVRSVLDLVGARAVIDPVTVPSMAPTLSSTDERPAADTRLRADELPIEEYQSLAASQVVARLPALTSDELGEVRRYEAAHRGRRTVLGRIDQLLVLS
jgi:hypothetical protein